MNNKLLGALALLGAPWMGIGFLVQDQYKHLTDSWWTAVWGIIYISAWMGGMVVLRRQQVSGTRRFGRALPVIILSTLTVANLSNVWQLLAPANKSPLFWALDMCWPLSHLLMLAFGVVVIRANRLTGWRRFVPLLCGLWLPFALTTKFLLPTTLGFNLALVYNVVTWSLLAVVALRAGQPDNRLTINDVVPV